MSTAQPIPASITQPAPGEITLSGDWSARTIGDLDEQFKTLPIADVTEIKIDGSRLTKIDSIGMWVLQRQLKKWRDKNMAVQLVQWPPQYLKLMEIVGQQVHIAIPAAHTSSLLERIGKKTEAAWQDALAMLSFVGETAVALAQLTVRPQRWRWAPVLHNIQTAGYQALPIVGMTSFLLGIVVAYQGADQLRHYGANIFVVDLVGYSMLREFAPLITAIIIAGRSGSAYAAQIGTMVVTEEIDALRTVGIEPIDLLVIPKLIALLIALPLLTIFADGVSVFGGMVMASSQLGVSFQEFIERFGHVISISHFLIGVGKAFLFAIVIAMIGCFQGFRTKSNADSVGRQTTRSVVQSIFVVIVLDAVLSIAFSMLEL